MTAMIEFFYSPTCPYCPKAKIILLEALDKIDQKIYFNEVNVLSPEGIKKTEKYRIMTVPTIIVNMRHKIVGVPTKEGLLKIINHEMIKKQIEGEKNEEC